MAKADYSVNYLVVFVSKYARSVFTGGIKELLEENLTAIIGRNTAGGEIVHIKPNQVRFTFSTGLNFPIHKFITRTKRELARTIGDVYPKVYKKVPSIIIRPYFLRSINNPYDDGYFDDEIADFVEKQSWHWTVHMKKEGIDWHPTDRLESYIFGEEEYLDQWEQLLSVIECEAMIEREQNVTHDPGSEYKGGSNDFSEFDQLLASSIANLSR